MLPRVIAIADSAAIYAQRYCLKFIYNMSFARKIFILTNDFNDNYPDVKWKSFPVFVKEAQPRVCGEQVKVDNTTTHKSKSRYVKKIDAYYENQAVDGVLYICVGGGGCFVVPSIIFILTGDLLA